MQICLLDSYHIHQVRSGYFILCHVTLVNLGDLKFPGVTFWADPIVEKGITAQGACIESPDTGITLTIPENTLSSAENDVDLLIRPCLNGPFELPAGFERASPAYFIEPSRRVELQRDITLEIHHYVRLKDEEDCTKMTFFSANATPAYRDSKPVYIFKPIPFSKGVFTPGSQVGEISARHFCFIITGCLGIGISI